MNCPRCQSPATKSTWRSRVRRGNKTLWIKLACLACQNCRLPTGPFKFLSVDLDRQNDQTMAVVWKEKFSESLPPALPGVRVRKIMRTEEGKERMAQAFGKVLAHQIKEKSP